MKMLVKDLIEELSKVDPLAEVYILWRNSDYAIEYNSYGDELREKKTTMEKTRLSLVKNPKLLEVYLE